MSSKSNEKKCGKLDTCSTQTLCNHCSAWLAVFVSWFKPSLLLPVGIDAFKINRRISAGQEIYPINTSLWSNLSLPKLVKTLPLPPVIVHCLPLAKKTPWTGGPRSRSNSTGLNGFWQRSRRMRRWTLSSCSPFPGQRRSWGSKEHPAGWNNAQHAQVRQGPNTTFQLNKFCLD